MMKNILIKAGVLGCIAVLGGAFGAHALKTILTPEQLTSFQTGVRYQMIHAVVLLFLFMATIKAKLDSKYFVWASRLIFLGVVLFSGSIYVLTFKNIMDIEALKFVGPITPIGGTLIILGWVFIIIGGVKLKIN